VKTLRILFVVLFVSSSSGFAQERPIVVAQAGGASSGAAPVASSSERRTLAAAVLAIAAGIALGTSNTVTTASHQSRCKPLVASLAGAGTPFLPAGRAVSHSDSLQGVLR
jgi:hypothetical protein